MVHPSTSSSVKDVKGAELKDVLTAAVNEPRLWIQRVVLMERSSIDTIIRDIPFTRGLNIISGKSSHENPEHPRPAFFSDSGHSVGKTTLCRLIRYLLGEQTFGTQKGQELIRGNFPEGWVAGEVVIDGEVWAIARPFAVRFKVRVAKDSSIEELFTPTFSGIGYGEYEQALRQLLPPRVDLPGISFDWKHLLAWIARDQESRLRDFWAWRDKTSESKTSFPAPVEHPRHLARAVFKMVSSATEKLEYSVSGLQERLKTAKEELNHKIVEPSFRLENSKKYLGQLLSEEGVRLAESGGPLFDFKMQSLAKRDCLRKDIEDKRKKLSEIDDKIARIVPIIHSLKSSISVISGSIDLQNDKIAMIEDPNDDPDEHRLRKLEQDIGFPCAYVPSLKVGDCLEVKKEYKRLVTNNIVRLDEQRQKNIDKQNLQNIAEKHSAAQSARMQKLEDYNEAIDLRKILLDKRSVLVNEIDGMSKKCSEIESYVDEYGRQMGIVDGSIIDESIERARENVEELSAELALEKSYLESEISSSACHVERICNIFSAFTKIVLGEEFSGIVKNNNEFSFAILDTGELSGAVIDTISIILGDITAMVCSSQGLSTHPGMLIHDSPREADLAPDLYSNIFNLLIKLVTYFGDNTTCPFQYIITTTTPAPDEAAPFIKPTFGKNSETNYLFGKKLTRQAQPEQLLLEE